MSRFKNPKSGQALVEFALIIVVLLLILFVIIETARLFEAWVSVQNSARAAGRYALTGQFETDCLQVFPPCLDPRVYSIKEEARRNARGLNIDPAAMVGEPNSFVAEVWGQTADDVWDEDYAGAAGKPVRVRVVYRLPIITPLLRPIAASVGLMGQVVVNNEDFDQASVSAGGSGPPEPVGPAPPIVPRADLGITKTIDGPNPNLIVDDPPSIYTTDRLTYTLYVKNLGPNDAEMVVVRDTLPAGSTYIGSSVIGVVPGGSCSLDGAQLECLLPNLDGDPVPANSARVEIAIDVPIEPAPGLANNVADVTSGPATEDPDLSNNTSSLAVELVPWAKLFVTKTDSADPVKSEDPFSYSIEVSNDGPNLATGVKLTDTLPAGATFVSVDPAGDCSYDGSVQVTCDVPNLVAMGATYVVTVNVLAPRTLVELTVTNNVSVSSDVTDRGRGDPDAAEDTLIVPRLTDLWVEKSDLEDPSVVGLPLTYSILVHHDGPDDAQGVMLEDTLPPGVLFDSATGPLGPCSFASGVVTCSMGDIPSGGVRSATVTVTPTELGTIFNTVEVIPGDPDVDPFLGNNTDVESTLITPWTDMEIDKSGPSFVYDGETFVYTIDVTNNGDYLAHDVMVYDDLSSDSGGGDVDYESGSAGCSGGGSWVRCQLGDIDVGETRTITIEVLADGFSSSKSFTNWAEVDALEPDLIPDNNTDSVETFIERSSDLELIKTAEGQAYAGVPFDYTIQVLNHGPSHARSLLVTDTLPLGITNDIDVNASSGNCSIDLSLGIFTCALGNVREGLSAWIDLTVTPVGADVITNTATAMSIEHDPGIFSNTDTITNTVLPAADLEIVKSGPDVVDVDEDIVYTLTITNHGISPASNVLVSDQLPAGVSGPTAVPSQGVCLVSLPTINCNLLSLDVGDSATIMITASPTGTGTVVNTATVTADEHDPDTSNNTSDVTTRIDADVDLEIAKSASDPVYVGGLLIYTLDIANNDGTYWAHDVTVTDTLPLTVTVASFSSGCGFAGSNIVVCDIGDMPPGGTETVEIAVTPSEDGQVLNTAVVAGDETDTVTGNNSASAISDVMSAADLAVTLTSPVATVTRRGPFTVTVEVTNNGPMTATNGLFTMSLEDKFLTMYTDTLPTGCVFDDINTISGMATITCNLADIAPGDSIVLSWEEEYQQQGNYQYAVEAYADEYDPVPPNNVESGIIDIVLPP